MTHKYKKALAKPIHILLGSILFAASLSFFLSPALIVAGGVSGIAILLAEFVPLGIGALFLLLNLPILLAGLIKFGKRFMISTLIATLLSSLFTEIFDAVLLRHLPLTDDILLSALFGGVLCGAGLGLVFRAGATTGGTDIGVRLLRLAFPHFKPGILFFLIDSIIVLASAFVFQSPEAALYSTLTLLATSAVMDLVLYGRDRAKLLFVISKQHRAIARRLLRETEVGVTYVDVEGAYTEKEKTMLLVAVKNRLYPKVREVIADTDPAAFTIVAGANEIYGEGFKAHTDEI